LERELRAAEAAPGDYFPSPEYRDGYIAALRWVLYGGQSPITGRSLRSVPVPEDWGAEMSVGTDIIGGSRRLPTGHARDFVTGAENALSWACFSTMAGMFDP
jgi:hypothetical protein